MSFSTFKWMYGFILFFVFGYFFSEYESLGRELFSFNYFVVLLLFLFSFYIVVKNEFNLNATLIVVVFFWFFYLVGLFIRPFFFPHDISMLNGIAIIVSFFIAVLGSVIYPNNFRLAKSNGFEKTPKNMKLMLFIGFAITVCSSLVWWALKGGIPIFKSNINIERTTNNYFAIRQLIFTAPASFWLALCFPRFFLINRRIMLFYFFVVSFCLLSTGYRSFPLGFFLVSLIIAYKMRYIPKINLKTISMLTIVLFFVLLFGVIRNQQTINVDDTRDSFAVAAQTFFNRPSGLQDMTNVFPRYFDHTGIGLYTRSFGFLLPGKQMGVGLWLKQEVLNADFVGGGYNPGILGELFIVGGYPAIFSGIFMWGVAISASLRLASSTNPFKVCSGAVLSFFIALSISPGFSTTIVNLTYYLVVLLIFSIVLFGPKTFYK